jgi:plasmid stabilization system protein ParE
VFYAVERVSDDGGRAEVFDPDAVRDVAFVMTRLMRDFLRRELESVEWRRLPTRLRARLACLEEAALDATLPAFDPRAAQRRVDALFGEVDALLGELPDISGFDPARLRELFNGRFVASLLEDECRHPEPDFEGLAP